MYVSQGTPSSVWSSGTRTLTSFGNGALLAAGTSSQPQLTATNMDLRPSANICRFVSVGVITPNTAGAGSSTSLWDGANFADFPNAAILVNANVSVNVGATDSVVGAVVRNTGSQTNHVWYSRSDLIQ